MSTVQRDLGTAQVNWDTRGLGRPAGPTASKSGAHRVPRLSAGDCSQGLRGGHGPPGSFHLWAPEGMGVGGRGANSPGKNTGVSSPSLLQGNLPTSPALQADSSASHQGSPRKKESPTEPGTGGVAGEAGGLAGKVVAAPGRARDVVTEGALGFLTEVFVFEAAALSGCGERRCSVCTSH